MDSEEKSKLKCFWKNVKNCNSGTVDNSNQIENASGTDNILGMWHDHYKSLFNSVQDVNDKPGVLAYIQNNMNHENFNVKVSDISDAISELPNDKSPRIDGLMSEHLENASYRLNVVLSVVLQAMLKHVIATVCSKIIEIFIVKKMWDYLWTTDNQFAYKKGHSTEMCIFCVKILYTLLL